MWCAVPGNSEKDSEGRQKGELCISLIKKCLALVTSHFSHHLLAVALPSGEAHGPIFFFL